MKAKELKTCASVQNPLLWRNSTTTRDMAIMLELVKENQLQRRQKKIIVQKDSSKSIISATNMPKPIFLTNVKTLQSQGSSQQT